MFINFSNFIILIPEYYKILDQISFKYFKDLFLIKYPHQPYLHIINLRLYFYFFLIHILFKLTINKKIFLILF
jgi:hypothetical protein